MNRMNRRRFLESTAAAVGIAALPLPRRLSAAPAIPDLVDVQGGDPARRVNAALDALGGIGRFVSRGDRVVLKANAGFANPPEWATTTHPEVVLAVARACVQAGARSVTVVENPTGSPGKCFKRCGLEAAFRALPEVELRLLGGDDFRALRIRDGISLKRTAVARQVLEADCFINLPVAKSHSAATVTFGLKNHMGVIQDRLSFHTLLDLHQAVADLARVVRPRLTLLDATRALLTNGPSGPGEVVTLDRLVAGRDIVAVDSYGLGLAEFQHRKLRVDDVRHIALAARAGVGRADVAALQLRKILL
ncbi:MAG: DUF362 domain-containing protein [Pseudomonadota bacterium]